MRRVQPPLPAAVESPFDEAFVSPFIIGKLAVRKGLVAQSIMRRKAAGAWSASPSLMAHPSCIPREGGASVFMKPSGISTRYRTDRGHRIESC